MLTLTRPQLAPVRASRQLTTSVEARVQEKGAKHLGKSRPKKVSGRGGGGRRDGGWRGIGPTRAPLATCWGPVPLLPPGAAFPRASLIPMKLYCDFRENRSHNVPVDAI